MPALMFCPVRGHISRVPCLAPCVPCVHQDTTSRLSPLLDRAWRHNRVLGKLGSAVGATPSSHPVTAGLCRHLSAIHECGAVNQQLTAIVGGYISSEGVGHRLASSLALDHTHLDAQVRPGCESVVNSLTAGWRNPLLGPTPSSLQVEG